LFRKIKRAYQILTSDLSFAEMEHLFRTDVPGLFEFYTQEMRKDKGKSKGLRLLFSFLKNLFVAFILKLRPARRIVYFVALYFFISGLWKSNIWHCFIGFAIINILLALELADKITAKDELDVARRIQTRLLPEKAPLNAFYDIVFFTEPAREVGGDFCDFIQGKPVNDNLKVLIADISGKGMEAALYMVQVHTIMTSLKTETGIKQYLVDLNDKLAPVLPPQVFMTSTIIELINNNELNLCRAGHLPVLHYSAVDRACTQLVPRGLGIGLTPNSLFANNLEALNLKTAKGDIIVLYTDGLIEAMNQYKKEFGEERLEKIICANADLDAYDIQNMILKGIAGFRGAAVPHDDMTLIVMKHK